MIETSRKRLNIISGAKRNRCNWGLGWIMDFRKKNVRRRIDLDKQITMEK